MRLSSTDRRCRECRCLSSHSVRWAGMSSTDKDPTEMTDERRKALTEGPHVPVTWNVQLPDAPEVLAQVAARWPEHVTFGLARGRSQDACCDQVAKSGVCYFEGEDEGEPVHS